MISPSSADLGGVRGSHPAHLHFLSGLVPRLMDCHGVAGAPFWSTHRLAPQAQSSMSSRHGNAPGGFARKIISVPIFHANSVLIPAAGPGAFPGSSLHCLGAGKVNRLAGALVLSETFRRGGSH